MPEGVEVELYRRAALVLVGRQVREVRIDDPWYVKGGSSPEGVRAELVGLRVTAVDRRGKLLLVRTGGPTLGLRFGMTGRLIVDGRGPIDELHYAGRGDRPEWDRIVIELTARHTLRVNDPRRLGGVVLDPFEGDLGPDMFGVDRTAFAERVGTRRGPLKAVLLDQSVISGLGNMLADELAFRARLDPAQPANTLSRHQLDRLWTELAPMLSELLERGGSHSGELSADLRVRGGRCPRCGSELIRRQIGGRTTFSCPVEQGPACENRNP